MVTMEGHKTGLPKRDAKNYKKNPICESKSLQRNEKLDIDNIPI